jgi:predicted phage terminase large subunit-like protein
MVSARIYRDKNGSNKRRIFILPNLVNRRMDFPTSLACVKKTALEVKPGKIAELVIENVGFQASYGQTLRQEGYKIEQYSVAGRDKRTRLTYTSEFVKNGTVLFPRNGCKDLIDQIVNFGIEKHDDLADAFSMCVDYAITRKYTSFFVARVSGGNEYTGGIEKILGRIIF